MADPKDQVNQGRGQRKETQQNAEDQQNPSGTRTDGGLGANGQSGEQRNDAGNDPDRHNTGVTGH